MSNVIFRQCEYCGKVFETNDSKKGLLKRFCNTSCSAFWRNKTYGPNLISEETKRKNSELLKLKWQDEKFRADNIQRMKIDNPVYRPGVIEKANETRLKNGTVRNNFKYGNGKMSDYEQLINEKVAHLGFIYNYAIPTKIARDLFPDMKFPYNYKPDFVNLANHICIEIDGKNHLKNNVKELDLKKEQCLKYLGFTVIRFTHEEIDNGRFDEWLNSYVNEQHK